MHISSLTFWLLVGSVVFAILLIISVLTWSHLKRKAIVEKYKNSAPSSKINKHVKIRKNHGQLLWEEKNNTKNPIDDYQMEFIVNTIFRNEYKTFNIIGFKEAYEKKSIEKLVNTKYVTMGFDFLLINGELSNINDEFDKHYNKLKPGKMVMIANASRHNKEIKRMLVYLKTIKAKYEWSKYGKGIIVVVK